MSVQTISFPVESSLFSPPVLADPNQPVRLTVAVPALPAFTKGRIGFCFYADNKDEPKAPAGRPIWIHGGPGGSAPLKHSRELRVPPKYLRLFVETKGIDGEALEGYDLQFIVEEV